MRMFDATSRAALLDTTLELIPFRQPNLEPLAIVRVKSLLEDHRRDLVTSREALERPRCEFAVPYNLGYFYVPWFCDHVSIVSRLHWLAAADALEEGDLATSELEALAKLLRDQLDAWTSDRDVLVVDRAMAMHSYEAVREEMLDFLLTDEDKKKFRAQNVLQKLRRLEPDQIDADQAAYLRHMQTLIEVCDQPYFKRAQAFESIDHELAHQQQTPEYPHLAAGLFLADLRSAVRRMAVDRASCEAWLVALGHGAGLFIEGVGVNPVHGKPYTVQRRPGEIEVLLEVEGERNPVARVPSQ
jgi:hypothetical protein